MRYLRPDTHPNSGLMISAEETWEEVKTDAQNRITKSIKYSNKNTAVISPESGNDSILIPAERVETTYRFNTTTNEITSILIETYQVFVIGKREAYTYTAGTLKPLKTSQKTLPSTNSESPLSDADKEVTVISPLVLARTERTTYRKLGNNKWRETITVTARGLNSETKTGTSEKGDTVGRVTTLGGMQTIQSKSKIVYSVPTAQKSDSPERELKEQVFRNLLKPTVSNPCSTFMTRREQVEINSNIDAAAFGQACALIRIDKLSPTVAGSLRCNSASIRALCAPFSTLVFDDALWVVSNISLSISAGAALDFAGDFKQIKNGVSTVDCPPIPPPKVEVTSLGDVFVLPVKINNFPVIEDVEFELPQTTNQPMPLKSAASGENVPPTALPATLQTDGTNTYLTQPGKLSVLSLDTAQVTTSPTPDFTVVSVVGGTALTPPQITDAPTTITLPPLLLEEEVFTLPITVSVNLLVESVLVELWEEKEILVNSQFFGVVDVTIADSDITVSAPFFPVN
jgi:hypothetical protein